MANGQKEDIVEKNWDVYLEVEVLGEYMTIHKEVKADNREEALQIVLKMADGSCDIKGRAYRHILEDED